MKNWATVQRSDDLFGVLKTLCRRKISSASKNIKGTLWSRPSYGSRVQIMFLFSVVFVARGVISLICLELLLLPPSPTKNAVHLISSQGYTHIHVFTARHCHDLCLRPSAHHHRPHWVMLFSSLFLPSSSARSLTLSLSAGGGGGGGGGGKSI